MVPAWQPASPGSGTRRHQLGHSGQAGNLLRRTACAHGALCFLDVQTEHLPLDISPQLEEALDLSEVEAEPSEGEDFEARGSRFSKSADERQRMLVQRKDDLLQQARK